MFYEEAGLSWVWRAFNVETRFSCVWCVQRGDGIVVRGCAFNVEAGLSCVCHAFNVEARRADL